MEPGKFGDLVLLAADPTKDIHNTTKISEVFLGGKEFDRAALDQMLRDVEAEAKSTAMSRQKLSRDHRVEKGAAIERNQSEQEDEVDGTRLLPETIRLLD